MEDAHEEKQNKKVYTVTAVTIYTKLSGYAGPSPDIRIYAYDTLEDAQDNCPQNILGGVLRTEFKIHEVVIGGSISNEIHRE